jgi:hypothetical protein
MTASAQPRYPTREEYAAMVGTRFTATAEDGRELVMELAEVVAPRTVTPPYEQFSVAFRAADDRTPQQAIYLLQADGSARVPVMLVPVAQDARGVVYEAVFSRLLEAGSEEAG